jgi:hypothetical protein
MSGKICIILLLKIVLDESGSVIWLFLRKSIGIISGLNSIMHFLSWFISALCL